MKIIWIASEGQNHKRLCPVGSLCDEYHSASEAGFEIQRNPEPKSLCVVELPLEDEAILEIIDTLRPATKATADPAFHSESAASCRGKRTFLESCTPAGSASGEPEATLGSSLLQL